MKMPAKIDAQLFAPCGIDCMVCDNTVYVRELEVISSLMENTDKGFPYKGAKEHHIVDVEDRQLLNHLIEELEKVFPVPVKKTKKGPA